MNGRWLVLLALLAGAAPAALRAGETPLQVCEAIRADGQHVRFAVEVAATPAAREHGLMARSSLPAGQGMWFDFGRAMPVVMWMKNTLISLDMAFVDEAGVVRGIAARTTPLSLDYLTAPMPVRYVLEVNGGELAERGIAIGDRMQLQPAR